MQRSRIDHVIADASVKNQLPESRFFWTIYQGVKVQLPAESLRSELNSEIDKVRRALTLEKVYEEPGVAVSRQAFRTLGLDPARYRPSQEALLRRILNGKEMYFINSGVDICNLLSIRYRLPMGLYDAAKIEGELILRIGTSEDVYAALNGRDVQCEQKLILCDAKGPVGGPYVDSQRTSITESTETFLHVVYFCHQGLKADAFADMSETFLRFHGGKAEGYRLI